MNNVDPEVLKQTMQGDDNAFYQIVETYQQPVFNLCFRMLGNAEAAEDAAQETFWRAYQSIRKYNPNRPFGTWLMSIAAHYCIDQHRKRKLLETDIDEYTAEAIPDHNTPNPESVALQSEHRNQVQALLEELPEIDRAIIVLRYWHECSEEEISQVLDISVNAVKSRLHRARKKLAVIWKNNQQLSPIVERMKNGSPAF